MSGLSQKSGRRCEAVDVIDIEIPKFHVVLYNDDYTTFEFVTDLLIEVFHHTAAAAERITMHIHQKGKGIAGTYSKEVAEMKVKSVHEAARKAGYPLRAGIESETQKSS